MENSILRRGDIVAVNIPGFSQTHHGVVISDQDCIEHSSCATVAVGTHNIDKAKGAYTVLVPDAEQYGLEMPTVFAGDQLFTVDQESMTPCGTMLNTPYWPELIGAVIAAMALGGRIVKQSAWATACEKTRTKRAKAEPPATPAEPAPEPTPAAIISPKIAIAPGATMKDLQTALHTPRTGFDKFNTFKGRILVYCPDCGKRFHFFAHEPVSQRECGCGFTIPLEAKAMHRFDYTCPACGDKSFGWTNTPDESYTDTCRCGKVLHFSFDKKASRYYGR